MNKVWPMPHFANLSGILDPSLYKMGQEPGGKIFFKTFHPSHSQSQHSFSVTLAFHWSTCFASFSALPVNYGYKPWVSSWSKRWKLTSTGKEHVDQPKSSHTERGVQTGTATSQSWQHPLEVNLHKHTLWPSSATHNYLTEMHIWIHQTHVQKCSLRHYLWEPKTRNYPKAHQEQNGYTIRLCAYNRTPYGNENTHIYVNGTHSQAGAFSRLENK